ncbi:hypothetical protein [Saccharothrix obliqua]|uniref:hypothetical protein n=1 Tax=Saccharothrix obliqua TaxID=2861747 RepID=UPI001C5D8FF9|nr:hypothetical protein [Saccharothrix obliqua]MBW4721869.1 hypothetical protein [Saccharothrix obliqua]
MSARGVGDLRDQVESLVVVATGRVVTAEDLRDSGGSLEAAGVNSIAYLNLVEALDHRYGVVVDPERDGDALATVDGIVALIRSARGGGVG